VAALTANAFEMLLSRLDANPMEASEKYEILRLKLIKCVSWRGCPESQADALADTVLDRVAIKIEKGEEIGNVNAYACEVLRFVWLEHSRKQKEDTTPGEEFPDIAVQPDLSLFEDPDLRMNCLRICLNEVVPDNDDRSLIVGYYDTELGIKVKDQRKSLAVRFGLTMTTLKVKACRIRARLEACINECVARAAVTKAPLADTTKHEEPVK
jgi:DNA-directed RNA polymerase specialized sigma24 family protein